MSRNRDKNLAYSKARGYRIRKILSECRVRAGCALCGYNKHPAALDFHHYKGEKFTGVTRMITYAEKRIVAEIAKCVVLCKNCHMEVEHSQ